jgi:cation transport regulator ChaB
MPYRGDDDPRLPPSVRRQLTRRQRRVWVAAFNAAWAERPGDEEYAFRAAWAAARRAAGGRKEVNTTEKAVTKTEGDFEFTADAYLYAPDPEKPSTWKLRIEEEPGKVTVAQLGRAAAALGPGFRGQRVDLEPDERRAAARKLIALYREQNVADEDIPAYLFEIAGMKGPEEKALRLDDLGDRVREAFLEEFAPQYVYGSPPAPGEPIPVPFWIEQAFEDHLIVYSPQDDCYWKIPFTLARRAVEGDPGSQEIVERIEFAPRNEWIRVLPTFVEMKAFDQADGRTRWIAVSSGGFEDRDGEIVSTAFLEEAVKAADADGERGTLDVWHIPGSDIGTCDWQAVWRGFLVESGLFDDTPAGRAAAARVKEAGDEYGMSIQFVFAQRTPDGVYLPPGRIVRRSVLPRDAAAFPWSGITLKEWGEAMKDIDERKRAELARLVGEEEAARILEAVGASAERLKQAGVRFKEVATATVAGERPADGENARTAGSFALPDAFAVELNDAALDALAEKAAARVIPALSERLQFATVADGLKSLQAAVDRLAADVAELRRSEEERIAEKAADLSRAQIRFVRRPTVANAAVAQTDGDAQRGEPLAKRGASIFNS